MKILVVDDENIVLSSCRLILEAENFEVLLAESVEQALDISYKRSSCAASHRCQDAGAGWNVSYEKSQRKVAGNTHHCHERLSGRRDHKTAAELGAADLYC